MNGPLEPFPFGDPAPVGLPANARAAGFALAGAPKVEERPLLLQIWRLIRRWKWVILGVVAASVIIAGIVTLLMTPKYTATSSIEIARQSEKIVNVEGVEPERDNIDLEFYQTQYELLRARSLAERVVTQLRLAEDDGFFRTFGVDVSGDSLFGAEPSQSSPAAQRKARVDAAIDILLENIAILPVRGSSIVNISFTSPDPQLSQRVANAWTAAFIQSNLDRRFDATSYARKFLEDRLGALRQRLEDSERNVVAYASRERIINIPTSQNESGVAGTERSLIADDLGRLSAELVDAVADRVKAESRVRAASGVSLEALNNNAITRLRERRGELAAEYQNLLTKFEPTYPQAVALSEQLRSLDASIAREESRVGSNLRTVYNEAVARENNLRAQVEQLKNDALDLRRRSIQYNIFKREADTNRILYDGLLQRYKEIGVAGGIGANNVMIVDSATVPDKPTSPNLLLNLAIALVAGSVAAAIAVFALEQIDEAVNDPAEVESVLSAPLLGVVPAVKQGEPIDLLADRKSSLAEAYLSVQTNLRFSTKRGIPRSMAVTSTRPAEGKSTTALALAQTLARLNKSVVLVDCDMRSPSVHKLVGAANAAGVSNLLSGDENFEALVLKSDALLLSIVPAGPQPPNAAELLNSNRLEELVERLLTRFDHVILDAPPVLGLADAPLIGGQVEGIVFAVEAAGPKAVDVQAALGRLRMANVNVLGVVLTKYERRQSGYGYGYGYGFEYGDKHSHRQELERA